MLILLIFHAVSGLERTQ